MIFRSVVGDVGGFGAVKVHVVDLELTIAVAFEGDLAVAPGKAASTGSAVAASTSTLTTGAATDSTSSFLE